MEIVINYWAVLACAVAAMALGFVWYGPLFGKKWMQISGADKLDQERRAEMMKGVWKLYITQFVLVFFQVTTLAFYIGGWKDASGLENALWIWVAFVMPTIASTSMWNNDSAKVSWAKFLIQAGYQLVVFVAFGLILGYWR